MEQKSHSQNAEREHGISESTLVFMFAMTASQPYCHTALCLRTCLTSIYARERKGKAKNSNAAGPRTITEEVICHQSFIPALRSCATLVHTHLWLTKEVTCRRVTRLGTSVTHSSSGIPPLSTHMSLQTHAWIMMPIICTGNTDSTLVRPGKSPGCLTKSYSDVRY